MEFFVQKRPGTRCDRKKPQVREHIVRLRARGYADTDIHAALAAAGLKVSVSLIDQVLREEGLVGLRKHTREERERVKAEFTRRKRLRCASVIVTLQTNAPTAELPP